MSAIELSKCYVFNAKIICILLIIVLFSCIFISFQTDTCGENFANDSFFSFKNDIHYQKVDLTAPDDEFKIPMNTMVGTADIYIEKEYMIDIKCYLYILNGNIFDDVSQSVIKQKYTVNLKSDKDTISLGDLKLDGDKVYKLKFSSKDIGYFSNFTDIEIVYISNEKEKVVLTGKIN